MNQSVVMTFILIFVANYVITTLYFVLVPTPRSDRAWPADPGTADRVTRYPPSAPSTSASATRSAELRQPPRLRRQGHDPRLVTDVILRLRYRKRGRSSTSATSPSARAPGSSAAAWSSWSSPCRSSPAPRSGSRATRASSRSAPRRFTGLVGSFANVREVTPLIAATALAAQVGRRLHGRDRRHAHQRRDRRPRGDVGAVARLPGVHPGGRDADRPGPDLPHLAVRQLLRHQAGHAPSSSASHRASTTTTSASTCR